MERQRPKEPRHAKELPAVTCKVQHERENISGAPSKLLVVLCSGLHGSGLALLRAVGVSSFSRLLANTLFRLGLGLRLLRGMVVDVFVVAAGLDLGSGLGLLCSSLGLLRSWLLCTLVLLFIIFCLCFDSGCFGFGFLCFLWDCFIVLVLGLLTACFLWSRFLVSFAVSICLLPTALLCWRLCRLLVVLILSKLVAVMGKRLRIDQTYSSFLLALAEHAFGTSAPFVAVQLRVLG